jgi:3-hydroxyacyl-CoA dehydrogenase
MNSIDADIIAATNDATARVNRGELVGLVVGNEATNFSVGANIMLVLMLSTMKQWDKLEEAVAGIQDAWMGMKHCYGPVVVAPRGMALGGGCECVMHGSHVRALGETYIGLVELGVGVIPAGGGCKELAFRRYGSIPHGVKADLFPLMQDLFMTIGTAKVATSAEEGRQLGFLGATDKISINPESLLADAKDDVLALVQMGHRKPEPTTVPVPGFNGLGALNIGVHTMKEGHYISEYDQHLGKKLAHVLCGGNVAPGTQLTEQDFLDLEREAFVSLCGEPKTLARIQHMLEKNKPLRN